MKFIKTHLVSLACGVAGLVFIVVTMLGMSGSKVLDEMESRVSAAREINSLRADPKNQKSIDAEQKRSKAFQEEYDATLAEAKKINTRQVLTAGIFPKTSIDSLPYKFKEDYQRALKLLPIQLDAGDLPNEADIEEENQNVADLMELEREKAEEGGDKAPAIRTRAARGSRRGTRSPRRTRGREPEVWGEEEFDERVAGGMGLAGAGRGPRGRRMAGRMSSGRVFRKPDKPQFDAVFRAQVSKATSIRCYAGASAFHVSPIVNMDTAPSPTEMWFAQVSMWVQDDVVQAIAQLNDAAAQQLKNADDAHVEHMPVKHIEAIRVWGYQLPGGLLGFPTSDRSTGANAPAGPSFSGRSSDSAFDVVRFTLVAVLDQREIIRLIDAVGKQNFYQCVNARYDTVEPVSSEGHMYGTAPAVRATFDFEGYMSREVYVPLMPDDVREMLGVNEGDPGDEG